MARGVPSGNGKRGPVLELAPLELDCMNMLWPAGEATVRDIREALAPIRPRAYTTIMTIMDRLAHKGVVERRKVGKAYVYRPNLTEEQARARAVEQVVENYFEGSQSSLAEYLSGGKQKSEGRRRNSEFRTQNSELTKPKAQEESVVDKGERPAENERRGVEAAMDETLL
jgi:predicted transcriptional regulator